MFLVCCPVWADIDKSLDKLHSELVSSVREDAGVRTIAISEFVETEGSQTVLGKFIAEELISRMVEEGTYEVVERRMLGRVLAGLQVSESDLLKVETVKKVGEVLGVQAILTGSLQQRGSRYVARARLLEVQTARVLSVGSVEVDTTEPKVRGLLGLAEQVSENGKRAVFYKQDWSDVEEGSGGQVTYAGVKFNIVRANANRINTLTCGGSAWVSEFMLFPNDFVLQYWITHRAWGNDHVLKKCMYPRIFLELDNGRLLRVGMDDKWKGVDPYYRGRLSTLKKLKELPCQVRVEKKGNVVKVFQAGNFIFNFNWPEGRSVIGFTYLVTSSCGFSNFLCYEPE